MAHIFANAVKTGHLMGDGGSVRTYLVVIDETPEAEMALRYAAHLASRTKSGVEILAIARKQDFVAWGAVQATIEAEARDHADEVAKRAFDMLGEESDITPTITLKKGDPATVIREMLAANPDIAALVLGAAPSGGPGPLVTQFAGTEAGTLPCPVIVVPGSLSRDALDKLS
jgi:nucleotide-binding universal stress UspA family protein